MDCSPLLARAVWIRALLAVVVFSAATPAAFAQAWVPPGGIGALTVVFQTIANTGHRLHDGTMLRGFDSASRGLLIEFDYALTDRLSVSASVPYLAAKYQGRSRAFSCCPQTVPVLNHGWQDVNVTVRYNLLNDAFALTPSVSIGTPAHEYNYFGEAVVGRNLNEVRLTLDAGQRLDFISPRLSVSGRSSFHLRGAGARPAEQSQQHGVRVGIPHLAPGFGARLGLVATFTRRP